ncbi:hypothetical protein CONPUDRAFT_150518 [Coniophora puteana RWD-64-598 SS2]|uniref:Uncharacterized protein n=1 Tax=Coniophora puteana (strain RWD-64-598) TaxID=741705 RepID=A0A5M3N2W7_CONPW|nr:uncharacterized protein CONPUDRAFT_150518 [Coniophora puteana RWD-64-598 SS2]EIW85729.1 hypothetical protein CONPUDRAFT_150518 [Coniophora puteana RWD-64-598 SS2]
MCCFRRVRNVYVQCGHAYTMPDELVSAPIQDAPPPPMTDGSMFTDPLREPELQVQPRPSR